MAPPSLLGPPQVANPVPPPQPDSTSRPPMGLTENCSPTFLTSGNPCLDLFFKVVPDTPSSYLHEQLPIAWAYNPLTTLKLICNLRGVRGTGKSDKEGFYTAALWLHKNHPKTLALNAASLAEFGYFKDLPEILYRLLEGADVRKEQKMDWQRRKGTIRRLVGRRGAGRRRVVKTSKKLAKAKAAKGKAESAAAGKQKLPKEVRMKVAAEKRRLEKEKFSAGRLEKKIAMAKKAVARYQRDPDYRFLHDRVSDLFAECLKSDMESLKNKETNKIGLAAKWCPSLDSSFDRATLLCESIARKIFTRESYPEYEGVEDAHYAYRVRDRLRKEVLVPLRKVLQLPEIYMGANKWGEIPYKRVASVAMKLYKGKFLKHDEERFKKYLEDVKAGKCTIAAGAVLPHEIIASLDDEDGGEVGELQWKRMVEDLVELGKLRNCMAVCDVSGSMNGTPMEVCVALGLLVSELSEEPWKGKVITFSQNPQMHLIQGLSLRSKCGFVRRMEWGMNTNFQKVFDLILQVAVEGKLKPEQMIRRVFVFSDMEFDAASGHGSSYGYGYYRYSESKDDESKKGWETDYEVIQRKFEEKGYGDAVPQIVFWNLRDSKSTPVTATTPGVALLSGFSKNALKLFLDDDIAKIQPDLVMEAAISGEEYQKLVVVD